MCSRERYLYEIVRLRSPHFSCRLCAVISGLVAGPDLDPSGAAVQSAKLTITDEATKLSRATITSDQGDYAFNAVTPATYTVTVEAPGFQAFGAPGRLVSTQAAVTVDLRLELGAVGEQVDVTAEAPPLQTADASTGQLIDSQKITDLPVLGRNPFFIGKLAQTVVFVANPKFARMQDQNGNFAGFDRGRSAAD